MASNRVYASYQEIIDLHTEENHVSVLGIHTPTGKTPLRMFKGLFEQFKKYKYKGCSISLVPAARLPADISQVSYEAGDIPIDPRDLLNPIMFHGCHGEDLGNILNRLYAIGSTGAGSFSLTNYDLDEFGGVFQFSEKGNANNLVANTLEQLYYKALVDNTWKKAHPQAGFRRSGLRPLVYSMATTHQLGNCDAGALSPMGQGNFGTVSPGLTIGINGEPIYGAGFTQDEDLLLSAPTKVNGIQFLTPHLTGLGYLDTKTVLTLSRVQKYDGDDVERGALDQLSDFFSYDNWTELPLVYMGVILLPPAYKAEQYYRLIVNHKFVFKDFRGISMSNSEIGSPSYFSSTEVVYSEEYPDEPPDVDAPPEPSPPPEGYDNLVLLGDVRQDGYYGSFTWTSGDEEPVSVTGTVYVVSSNAFTGMFAIDDSFGNGRNYIEPYVLTPSGNYLSYSGPDPNDSGKYLFHQAGGDYISYNAALLNGVFENKWDEVLAVRDGSLAYAGENEGADSYLVIPEGAADESE